MFNKVYTDHLKIQDEFIQCKDIALIHIPMKVNQE